jgi:hypothetical protein
VFLSLLKAILKGLKQATSKGWTACHVCEGKIIISNLNYLVCSIASRVTWDPCPSKVNKCLFVKDIPLSIDLLKRQKFPKKVGSHPFFDYIAIQALNLYSCM